MDSAIKKMGGSSLSALDSERLPHHSVSDRFLRKLSGLGRLVGHAGSSLLPPDLEKLRSRTVVCPNLLINAHPALDTSALVRASEGKDEYGTFHRLTKPFCLSEEVGIGNTSFHFVDKMRPHALLELMVTQSAPDIKSRYLDLDNAGKDWTIGIMVKFANYCTAQGLYPVCSFSIDPDTFDRKSGQSSKRFHVHLVARTAAELDEIEYNSCPLASLDILTQRKLIDESAIVLSMLTRDYLVRRQNSVESSFDFKNPLSSPKTPFLSTIGLATWSDFESELTKNRFEDLQASFEQLYAYLDSLLCVGKYGYWKRPVFHPDLRCGSELNRRLDTLSFISEESRQALAHFIGKVHPEILGEFSSRVDTEMNRALISHLYPHAGASYSVTVSTNEGVPEIVFRPFLFSDTGGAGLSSVNGTIVKTIKVNGVPFTPEQMIKRETFQREFLATIGIESIDLGWKATVRRNY